MDILVDEITIEEVWNNQTIAKRRNLLFEARLSNHLLYLDWYELTFTEQEILEHYLQ